MHCARVKSSPSYVHVCEVKYDQAESSLQTNGLPENDLFTNYRLNRNNANRFISIVYSASERNTTRLKRNIHHPLFNDLDDVSEMNSDDSNFMQLDEVNEKTWRYPLPDHLKKLPNLNGVKELKKSRTDSLLNNPTKFNYDPRRFSMYATENNTHRHHHQTALDTEDNDYYPSELVNNSTFRVSLKSRSKSLFVYNEKSDLLSRNELNDLPSSKEAFARTWTRSHFANTSNNMNESNTAKPNEKRPSFEYLSLVNGGGNNTSGQTNLQYITQTAIKIVPSEKNLNERRKSKYTIDVNKLPFNADDEANKRRVSIRPNQVSDEQSRNQWIRSVRNEHTDDHKRKRKPKENKIQFDLDQKDFGEIDELDMSLSSAGSVENLLSMQNEASNEVKTSEKPVEQEERRDEKSSDEDYFKIENQAKSPVEKRTKKNKTSKENEEVEVKDSQVVQEKSEELTRVDEEIQQIEENNAQPEMQTSAQYDFSWLNNRKKKEKQEESDYRTKSRTFSVINYDDSDDEPEKEYHEPEKVSRNYNYINMRPKMRFSIPTESSDNLDEMKLPESIEDWLLKWYISKESKNKVYEEAFRAHDVRHKGYLRGADLLDALESTCDLDNLKLNYLFSVLKLCDVDVMKSGADLKVFIILNALAHRIRHLDDTWFMNLLPQMNMSTVENKMFKVKNLWKFLADHKSKTISVSDLMIEFAAGGVTGPHIDYAREKLSSKLTFDLLDYISYVPLFVHIHDKIVVNPLDRKDDI